jgi:membrane protease subunit HflK
VTRDRLYIDAMRDVYANVTKVMVDSRGNSSLLYLPLDKLIQQTGAAAPAAPAPAPAAPADSAGTDRSRDIRSRDRDSR